MLACSLYRYYVAEVVNFEDGATTVIYEGDPTPCDEDLTLDGPQKWQMFRQSERDPSAYSRYGYLCLR